MNLDLNQIHQAVSRLAPAIDRLLLKQFNHRMKVSYKAGGVDYLGVSIVTEVDRQVETILKKNLGRILTEAGFIGEETASTVKDLNWIVDPIDGTLNFARHIPNFAVSIALWQKNQPLYAFVSMPLMAETIYAIKSKGVFLNGKRVQPLKKNPKKLFLTYSIVGVADTQRRVLNELLEFAPAPRSYGSSVFHGAQIALGRIDAGVFINQAIWDIAAIVLLAQEAGLTVKYVSAAPDITKDNLKNYQYSLVIGSKTLVNQLVAKLKPVL